MTVAYVSMNAMAISMIPSALAILINKRKNDITNMLFLHGVVKHVKQYFALKFLPPFPNGHISIANEFC